jgi:glycosyltransferase involved in cell wall biosynthesis
MNMGIPKILHVLRSPRAEGTVKLAVDLMRTTEAHHEMLVLEAEPAEMIGVLRQTARWIRIEPALPRGAKKFPWIVLKVWKACRERKPDIVVCWPNGFGAFVLLGAAFAGVRGLITHAGNPPTPTGAGRAHTVMTTGIVWVLGGRMVCCSHYVADQFARTSGAFTSILRVVYNCAPLAEIREAAATARAQRSDREHRLIMVATLESHKDHATLLQAMPEVVAAVPNARLWLVGEGSLREALQKECLSLDLNGTVTFLGSRRDVPALLGQCDVFVFSTTEQEGMGTVLIEAMAAGMAVVASDVPACREVLADGRWGRLSVAGNSSSLANELVFSLLNHDKADSDDRRDSLHKYLPARMMAAYLAAVS